MNQTIAYREGSDDDLVQCSIQNWYSAFQKHTFKTHIIELSDTIVTWLIADGIVLRNIEDAFPTREKDPYDTSDSWSTESSSSSAETGGAPPEELAEVYARVKDAIDELGGCVIPKLQWSCPKDASWMMPNNTIQCSTADDVFLLLKSSDRIAHDVEVLQQICHQSSPRSPLVSSTMTHNHDDDDKEEDEEEEEMVKIPEKAHVLALRRWYDLKPGREFRCFVKNNRLIAISQRDVSCKYQHIIDHVDAIKQRIQHMYDTVIHTRFSLVNFSFDCYVPEAEHASVRIIDFNPFHHQDEEDQEQQQEQEHVMVSAVTNPLLFTWEDIHALSNTQDERVEFRYIDQDVPVQPESALYGVPFDFVDTRQGSALTNLLDQANASWKEFESTYSPQE
ncbi:hypothetical protein M9435_005802 [Picochlorum sp. BPE23]|nr:hypothetical protein M9435_005802 [Picochlorum sp. BPE23]